MLISSSAYHDEEVAIHHGESGTHKTSADVHACIRYLVIRVHEAAVIAI